MSGNKGRGQTEVNGYSVFHDQVVFEDRVEFRMAPKVRSIASTNVVASGTTAADATILRATINVSRSGGEDAGVRLPAFDGVVVWVTNAATTTIKIYPPAGYSIDENEVDAPIVAAIGAQLMLMCVGEQVMQLN
jgi:hypothetical protein